MDSPQRSLQLNKERMTFHLCYLSLLHLLLSHPAALICSVLMMNLCLTHCSFPGFTYSCGSRCVSHVGCTCVYLGFFSTRMGLCDKEKNICLLSSALKTVYQRWQTFQFKCGVKSSRHSPPPSCHFHLFPEGHHCPSLSVVVT